MNKLLIAIIAIFLIGGGMYILLQSSIPLRYKSNSNEINNFIIVDHPQPDDTVVSPLKITGKARGIWFQNGQFRIRIFRKLECDYATDTTIGYGVAKATSNWETEDFVPFEALIEFSKPINCGKTIFIGLNKENPSGLKEKGDKELIIPIKF
jgi:hypothetical protein